MFEYTPCQRRYAPSNLEIILVSAIGQACAKNQKAVRAWNMELRSTLQGLVKTHKERCYFDVADAAMELADIGVQPNPVELFSGWLES